jgi:DNA-binding SARP family transcriptional activator
MGAAARTESLSLLGTVVFGGEPIPVPASTTWRLVALVASRGAATREGVAAALWPEADAQHAHGAVRTALWRVHRRWPGLLAGSAASVRISQRVTVDAHDLVETARRVLAGDPDAGRAGFGLLVDAGELLPGWEDEWVYGERERLRQLRLHALEALAYQMSERREFGLAVEAALAAVRAEPLRETAQRALIRVHLREGNLVEARRQYDECARLFAREIGVTPTRETTELVGLA